MKIRLIIVFAMSCFFTSTFATQTDEVVAIFKNLNTIQGQFKQTLYNQKNKSIAESTGSFIIERPNKFVWNVASPNAQLSISNGKVIWIYQPDLEQVTKSQLTQQIGSTPLAILSGSADALKHAYQIGKESDINTGTQIFIFHAKDQSSPFTTVRLYFKLKELTQMQLQDTLGQKTQIEFINLRFNQSVNSTVFTFVPPKGTDIIE